MVFSRVISEVDTKLERFLKGGALDCPSIDHYKVCLGTVVEKDNNRHYVRTIEAGFEKTKCKISLGINGSKYE